MIRRAVVLPLVLLLVCSQLAVAQGTPEALVEPGTGECLFDPLPMGTLPSLAERFIGQVQQLDNVSGAPSGQATIDAVTASLVSAISCANEASTPLGVLGAFTENGIVNHFGLTADADVSVEQIAEQLTRAETTELDPAPNLTLISVLNIVDLDEGLDGEPRVGALIVTSQEDIDPYPNVDFVIMAKVGDTYMIDDLIDDPMNLYDSWNVIGSTGGVRALEIWGCSGRCKCITGKKCGVGDIVEFAMLDEYTGAMQEKFSQTAYSADNVGNVKVSRTY